MGFFTRKEGTSRFWYFTGCFLIVLFSLIVGFAAINAYYYFTSERGEKTREAEGGKQSNIAANLELVSVKRVIDGDSFYIADGREARLIGIDAPEMKTDDPFSGKAKEYLTRIIEGKTIYIELGDEPKDDYNRILVYAYDFKTQKMINLAMIDEGLAYMYFFPNNMRYFDEFAKAQAAAREAKKNLWSLDAKPEEYYVVSFNVTHRPECPRLANSHKKMTKYATRNEALDTGSPPCRECKP
jgi:micrococcal nuclease